MSLHKLKRTAMKVKCHLRSICKARSDKQYYANFFESDWEVFVVKKDKGTGTLGWSTMCCDSALSGSGNDNGSIAAACC